jgi:hypothetical protein
LEALPGVLVEHSEEKEILRVHGGRCARGLLNLPESKVAANELPNPSTAVKDP